MITPQRESALKRALIFIALVLPLTAIAGFGTRDIYAKKPVHKLTFACTFNCMDGRVQDLVNNKTKQECGSKFVDVITHAGIVKDLAENKNKTLIDSFREGFVISVKKHGTKKVTIAAHEDCAVNPVSKEQQIKWLHQAKKTVESWELGVEVILLWVEDPFKEAKIVK